MWGDEGEVTQNRKKFLESLYVPTDNCAMLSLVHGADIVYVSKKDTHSSLERKTIANADAMMTAEKGIYFLMLTADCLPILFYDPMQSVISLAHCGWKSTDQHLASKVVREMGKVYGCDPANIIVGIGPGIHKESYIFENCVQKTMPSWKPFLTDLPNGKTAVDIVEYNKQQLQDEGIAEGNIEIMDINTAKSPDFFSHYCATWEGQVEARFLTVLGMRE